MASKKPRKALLSVIIPAYKQEKTIIRDIQQVKKELIKMRLAYEVIVVIDGNLDKTRKVLKKKKIPRVKLVGYKHNHGKGYAVRFGMANARGSILAFLDAGMDLHPKGLKKLLSIMKKEKADIVIGSKLHPDSFVTYPWQRKILSFGYRTLVKVLFGLSVRDTQVGMKLFKREVLEAVLPRLLVKRYAFDIEILAVARHLGYKNLKEGPVMLTYGQWSSITSGNFWSPIGRMLWDTCAVFYRLKIRRYYDTSNKRKWRYDPELNFRINIG